MEIGFVAHHQIGNKILITFCEFCKTHVYSRRACPSKGWLRDEGFSLIESCTKNDANNARREVVDSAEQHV